MRSTFKKGLSVLLALVLVFGSVAIGGEGIGQFLNSLAMTAQASTNGHTQAEAVAWIQARGDEGWWQDVDGVYGCQCVDLIYKYYQYLVGSHVGGNGYNYVNNSLPAGWWRDNTPSPGAIVVWGANKYNGSYNVGEYGHVGLVRAVSGNTIYTVETNLVSPYDGASGRSNAKHQTRAANYASCYIHPDFPPDTFTVSFNANGGSVSPTSKTVSKGSTYGTLPTPTRTGYTFTGWYTAASGGTQITASSTVSITANQTLYAHWTAKTYNVNFDVNHDSIKPNLFAASTASVTKDGMSYRYDATNDTIILNGTATASDGEFSSMPFKAEATTYKVTVTRISGSSSATNACFVLELKGNQNLGTRQHLNFNGSGSTTFTVSSEDAAKINCVKLWQWKQANGTLTATNAVYQIKIEKASTATAFSPTAKTVTYGSTYGTLPTPTRTGYTFTGWYTAASGGTQITASSTVSITANQTLYAHWTAKTYNVNFDVNHDSIKPNLFAASTASVTKDGMTYRYDATNDTIILNGTATASDGEFSSMPFKAEATTYKVTVTRISGSSSATNACFVLELKGNQNLGTRQHLNFNGSGSTTFTVSSEDAAKINCVKLWQWKKDSTASLTATNAVYQIKIEKASSATEFSPTTKTVTYNSTYGTLPTPTRTGYTFAGWYTAASGGTQITAGTTVSITFNQTLYAYWTANTPAVNPVAGSNTVVDESKHFIYGLSAGSAQGCVSVTNGTVTYEYPTAKQAMGTGTKVKVYDIEQALVDTYIVVVFGDIDGDGWYDGTDAYFVNLVANGMVSADDLTEAQRMAADCNHDGTIDNADVALLEQAGLLLANVDQTLPSEELQTDSIYLDYCSLIDQTVEIIEPDQPAQTAEQPTAPSVWGWIKALFTIVLNWLLRVF